MLRACLRACTQCGLVWSDFWLLEQIKKYGGVSSEFLWLDHWFWIYWPVHARCCVRACTQGGLRHQICCCWNKYAKIMWLCLSLSLSSQICNKLLPTRSSSSTSATVTTSTIFELASSQKALYNFKKLYSKRYGVNYFSSSTSITVTTSIKFPKRQSVSELVTSIANDRTRVR